MANINKDVILKDVDGTYLFPLAHADDQGKVLRTTYLKKDGDDSYICEVRKETVIDPKTGAEVEKLILVNQNDPDNPIEFIGGDAGYAAWGAIVGDITDQGDLQLYVNREITIAASNKNRVYVRAFVPEGDSGHPLLDGDLWYNIGDIEGYTKGIWYSYSEYLQEWVPRQDDEHTAQITLNQESITSEVEARIAGEAAIHSEIIQTADKILSVVETKAQVFRQPEAPEPSSELVINEGDL